jgi:hypothetical protein
MDVRNWMSSRRWLRIGAAAAIGAWIASAQAASPEAKLDAGVVAEITKDWPAASKSVANDVLQK